MLSAFPLRAASARRLFRLGLVLAVVLATSTCATPTDAPDPPGGNPPGENPPAPFEGSLDLSGPASLLVNQSELFTVTAKDAQGQTVSPWPVGFRSSDQSVALVSANGVVTARGRGTATITATRDSAADSITVQVHARLALNPVAGWEWASHIPPTVGDEIQLEPQYVDVNGKLLGAATASGWSSSDPGVASVTQDGLVTTHSAFQEVTITASTPEGAVSRTFVAEEVQPPRLVRLVHGAVDLGPLTFRVHGQPDITLNLGEVSDVMLTANQIFVQVDGMPAAELERHSFAGFVTPQLKFSVFAVHGPKFGGLVVGWSPPNPVQPGMSMIRVIQGGSIPVVYFREPGVGTAGLAEHCYFDPGEITSYYPRSSGDFDILMQAKVGMVRDPAQPYARMPSAAPDGQAMTIVLSGNTTGTSGYISFIDP